LGVGAGREGKKKTKRKTLKGSRDDADETSLRDQRTSGKRMTEVEKKLRGLRRRAPGAEKERPVNLSQALTCGAYYRKKIRKKKKMKKPPWKRIYSNCRPELPIESRAAWKKGKSSSGGIGWGGAKKPLKQPNPLVPVGIPANLPKRD